jgi:hypothetical protein
MSNYTTKAKASQLPNSSQQQDREEERGSEAAEEDVCNCMIMTTTSPHQPKTNHVEAAILPSLRP